MSHRARDKNTIREKLKEPEEQSRWEGNHYSEWWAEEDQNPRTSCDKICYFIIVLFFTYHLNITNIFFLLQTITNDGMSLHYGFW